MNKPKRDKKRIIAASIAILLALVMVLPAVMVLISALF